VNYLLKLFVRLISVVSLLLALSTSGTSFGRETIAWGVLDFPPFQILNGESRSKGSFDGLLNLLIEQMPEYDHDVIPMTFARREEQFHRGEPLCTPGLFRTAEREKFLVFSIPALIHLDNRLVFLTSNASAFEGSGPVDLEAILKRQDMVGGIVNQRSFAPNIDLLVRQYANSKNVVLRALRPQQMFELMLNSEIDYTILFPHEAAFLGHQLKTLTKTKVRPIVGTPPYIFTHVACTKSAWGEATIARINKILLAKRKSPAYRALSERWYEDSDKALIRKYYQELLLPGQGKP